VYDLLSAEAVGTFLNGAQVLKNSLNHGIDLLGVVGMLTYQQGKLSVREENAKRAAMGQVSQTWSANYHFFDRHIPRKTNIAEAAGQDIAYFQDPTVRDWFDKLGGEIGERLGWNLDAAQRRGTPRVAHTASPGLMPEEQGAIGS
jgi:hypothetical protein